MHDCALRRAEAIGLDLAHVDLERRVIHILGKGKTGRVPLTTPKPTRAALADWIAARENKPTLHRLDHGASGEWFGRLTGHGVYKIVKALGKAAGLLRPQRPHGLRHQAITQALEVTGGNVRAILPAVQPARQDRHPIGLRQRAAGPRRRRRTSGGRGLSRPAKVS